MLAGEPYVLEYKKNIQKQLSTIRGFADVAFKEIVPNHVSIWTLTRRTATPKAKRAMRWASRVRPAIEFQ
jgi:hypothetical protein